MTTARDDAITLTVFRIDKHQKPEPADVDLLSPDELERAHRFRVEGPRHVFVAARAELRRTLGQALDKDPRCLEFVYGEHGKPRLQPETELRFNLSHSGSTIAIATARGVNLGADVEELRRTLETERLARRFFAPSEAHAVEFAPDTRRLRLFFHFWTAKEAVLKATGSGLSVPVREVEVSTDPDTVPRVVAIAGDADEASRWQLLRTEYPGRWIVTIAWLGAPPADRGHTVGNTSLHTLRRVWRLSEPGLTKA